jgi:membrane-associated protein
VVVSLAGIVDVSTQFVKSHPELACFFFFLWAFLETGLLFGLFLPAEKVLVVGAFLSSKGLVSPLGFFVCASSGTVLGYMASYFAGFFLGEELSEQKVPFVNFSPETLHRAERFVREKGVYALVLGRFLPFLRAVLPVVMGTFRMPFALFFLFNLLGAFLWIFSYLLLGNLIGALFSFIIDHKLQFAGAVVFLLSVLAFWRWYGKDKGVL